MLNLDQPLGLEHSYRVVDPSSGDFGQVAEFLGGTRIETGQPDETSGLVLLQPELLEEFGRFLHVGIFIHALSYLTGPPN